MNEKNKAKTPEQVIECMNTDMSYYKEWLEELAIIALRKDEKLLQSWLDWFNAEGEFADGSKRLDEVM